MARAFLTEPAHFTLFLARGVLMEWYYIADGGKVGPVDDAEMARLVSDGTVQRGTKVWAPGKEDWSEVERTDLGRLLPAPPPLPKPRGAGFLAWWLAINPLLFALLLAAVLPRGNADPSAFGGIFISTGILGLIDIDRLRRAGYRPPNALWLLCPAPVYLWLRARRIGGGQWYAWLSAILLVVLFTLPRFLNQE